jgi:hypothetical protein
MNQFIKKKKKKKSGNIILLQVGHATLSREVRQRALSHFLFWNKDIGKGICMLAAQTDKYPLYGLSHFFLLCFSKS